MATGTDTKTVWVTNLATGHTHGMSAEQAAYYLNSRDPLTGSALYEEGSEPKTDDQGNVSLEDVKNQEARDRLARRRGAPVTTMSDTGKTGRIDSTPERFPHGVPDAARMEVATSASELGPTIRKEAEDRKAVTGNDYASSDGPDRIAHAEQAATTNQETADLDSRKEAAKAAKAAAKGGTKTQKDQ
jgi:hypothetical protein